MPRDTPFQMAPVKDSTTIFGAKFAGPSVFAGGLDLLTPNLVLHPGACRDMQNFEVSQNGGYGRIAGYERYSGQPAPSDATFSVVQVDAFASVPSVGDTISQASSGASGTVALVNNVAGLYYMVVTQTSGTFDTAGVITSPNNSYTITSANPLVVTAANSPFVVPLAGTTIGTAIPLALQLTALLNAQYLAAAADIYRDAIGPVPGSGPLLAVIHMIFSGQDNVYAFRANALGTAVNIYKSSTAGWVLVPLFNTLNFVDGGTSEPIDGETITQGPATATIKRVMWQSGSFDDDSAVGTFVVTTPNFGFSAGMATTASGSTVLLTGPQTPIVIQPGGTYEWDKHNFSGQLITRAIWGCDGVNKAFMFDGETYAPITSGLSPDNPNHIACSKGHLFLSKASSVIYSGDGTPFLFSAIDGGGEIATGDTVTALRPLPGNQSTAALGVWMDSTTGIVYGTGSETFNFVIYNQGTGANARSVQNLFDTIAFPNQGIVSLQTTLNYGNFNSSTLTKNIQPLINQQRSKISASTVNRSKGQYRVFFNDGTALYLTFNNQAYLGAAPMLFLNAVSTIDNDTDTSGDEVTYFGSSDSLGYVYQLDAGPSFDGENLFAYFVPAWDYLKSPRFLKRFYCASIEMQGSAYAAISFNYALGDNSPLIGQPSAVSYASSFSPALWDSATWDNFFWDGQTVSPTYADMTGTGQDVQPTISSTTNYIEAFNVSSVIYQFSVRRRLRGM